MKQRRMKQADGTDGRLTNQRDYLLGRRLIWADFVPTPRWDHEHCAFCWAKFGEYWQHTGYCTLDRYYWICEQCFRDFREEFHWIVEDAREARDSETQDN